MSNKSNHLNTIHTTRPAVALFRKPLATNDEMNNELRKLLGEFVEIQSETKTGTRIKKNVTVNGNIKAVFYNPLFHYSIPVHYNENIMFSKYYGKYLGDHLTVYTEEGAELRLKSGFINNLQEVKKETKTIRVPTSSSSIPTLAGTMSPTSVTIEETSTDYMGLTWYVIVYDNDYIVPTQEKSKTLRGGQEYYTLNQEIIKSTEKLNLNQAVNESWYSSIEYNPISPIGDTASGYYYERDRINKINELGIPLAPKAIYKIILQNKVITSKQTYKDVQDKIGQKYISRNVLLKYQKNKAKISEVQVLYNDMRPEALILNSEKGPYLYGVVPIRELNSYIGIMGSYNLFDEILEDAHINPTVEFEAKGAKVSYDYEKKGLILNSKASKLNTKELTGIYIILAERLNNIIYQNTGKRFLQNVEKDPISNGLYEFPLRLKLDKLVTSGYNATTNEINTIYQFYAALSSFSSKDIISISTKKIPYNIVKEYRTAEAIQAAVPNPKLIDFKLLYYLFIEYNVVVPKYKKLEDDFIEATNQNSLNGISFSKQSLVKMVPSDFFSITQNVADQTNINNVSSELYDKTKNYTPKQIISKWYETITKWDNETKETLCRRYEDIYYGNWSGFYYSNSTLNEESIAGYTNTKVPFSYTSGTKISYSPYIMSDSSTSYVENSLNALNVNDISNRDVTSITVSREMTGESSATVIINAINEKYTYKTGLNKGKSLFDPYDEVILFLPNLDGTISQSFKGYITSIQQVNNQGYHNIALQCSCPLTLLQRVRTNIKPSFDLIEASGSYPTPFSVREDLYKSIENWIPFMCIQGLSYFTSMLHPFTQSDLTDDLYTIAVDQKNNQITMPSFNDLLLNYLWFRDSNNASDQNNASYFLNELIQEYTSTVSYLNLKGSETSLYTKGIQSVASVYSYNNTVNKDEYKKVEYEVYAQRDGFNESLTAKSSNLIERTLVAKITGTLQPTFALGTSDIPLVFSNYKPNMEILKETAEKFNFAFYSRRDGVVMFEPINTSLFNLNLALQNTDKNYSIYKDYSKITDSVYNIPDILNYQTVVKFEDKEEVDKIVNWLQIAGSYREDESLSGEGVGSATTIVDVPSIKKYGTHAQNQQAILGITNMDALKVYASALMDRQNRYFRTASCTTLGNGNAEVNCPVYSAINNTMYIRTGLVLNYKAGDSFTSDHVLHWGKKPLHDFTTKETKDSINNALEKSNIMQSSSDLDIQEAYYTPINNIILEVVKSLNQSNEINPAYYRQLSFILTNKGSQYLLPLFVFNGYLWEGLASISFEDLSTYNPTDAILSGLQTSLFTKLATKSSDKETYKDTVSMKDVGFKEATKELADISQNLRNVAVGIYNSANKQDIRSIYVGTGKFSIK